MMTIIENNECTGCHACYSVCPKQAITMVKDDKGFKVYKIDEEKCIKCGLCKKVCPVLNSRIIESKPEAFAIINKDEEIRKHSSSGGVFSLIAEHIIKDGGVVFGAFLEGQLKGFASVETEKKKKNQEYMDLSSIHVSEDMRGHGIGKQLFQLAAAWAKSNGGEKLYISAHSAVESQAFYHAMGCVEAVEYKKEHVEQEPYDRQLEYWL